MTAMHEWLIEAAKRQASDLHLSAGLPPVLRIHGQLMPMPQPALSHGQVLDHLHSLMSEAQRKTYAAELELDFAQDIEGLGRFRINAFHQVRGAAAAVRLIPSEVCSLQALSAPPILAELALRSSGLVLVTGPTGSGKSSTLAAMVDHRNALQADHILTIEDPVEFVHTGRRSIIHQREVGAHTHSFAAALRSALREDPDVILVGELRDLETIRLALTAAETGHLVLGTLHTAGAAQTIDRVIDVFSADDKAVVRTLLAESLLAVVSQTLCRRVDGRGRVAAMEVMVVNPAIRHLIRENKVAQMVSVMQSGQAQGMQTLDQHLAELVRQGVILREEARGHARFPENFR